MRYRRLAALLIASMVLVPSLSSAQSVQRSEAGVEIGGMLGVIKFQDPIGESPFEAGLRVGYVITPNIAAEVAVAHCPENPSGNFGVAGPVPPYHSRPGTIHNAQLTAGLMVRL